MSYNLLLFRPFMVVHKNNFHVHPLRQILGDFRNIFCGQISGKLEKHYSVTSKTRRENKSALPEFDYISQGSVATRLGCDRIFDDHSIANLRQNTS